MLSAKLQRLKLEARRAGLAANLPLAEMPWASAASETVFNSKINSCSSPAERAHWMLALLALQSGAEGGLLYLVTGEDCVRFVCSLSDEVPSPRLEDMVRQFISAELAAEELSTDAPITCGATVGWTDETQLHYRPVLLSHHTEADCIVTGMAVLRVMPGKPFVHPSEGASRVSRLLLGLGDCSGTSVTKLH
jgi:hypothetical protein